MTMGSGPQAKTPVPIFWVRVREGDEEWAISMDARAVRCVRVPEVQTEST